MMVRELSVSVFVAALFLMTAPSAMSQSKISNVGQPPSLPKVFLLGEYEKTYEEIMPGYTTLLEACDGNMKTAFNKLMGMMHEMEAYAALTRYDLRDVKAWMHFFWRKDGTIEHIGFYLKPNSRNVNTDSLKNFLAGFAKQYKFPLNSDVKFAHYSTFSFPLIYKKDFAGTNTAKNN